MNRFAVLSLSILLSSTFSHAKISFPIVCGLQRGQDMSKMTGYRITQGMKIVNGAPKEILSLQELKNGKIKASKIIPGPIQAYSEAEVRADGDMIDFIRSTGVSPSEVKSGKSIEITDGDPAVVLVNYFNRNGMMLTGALIVPMGGLQECFPVTQ